MCGIFGVYNYSGEIINKEKFISANNKLEHRGPDGEGYYWDNSSSLAFGHRRLSIIDIDGGNQPMCNEDGTVWITFNGEIYNFKDLRSDLAEKGHRFKTNCDTEVIVHLYEEYGRDCIKKLNGIFAFGIWDKRKRSLFLARDHFGVKPLYYCKGNNQFIFASEIKAILNYVGTKPTVDLKALNYCLTFRHTPAPYTLFNGISKLQASHSVILDSEGNLTLYNYWDRKISVNKSKSEKDWIELLNNRLESSVKSQMISDVPIGISLSGGVDSGAILSLMSKYQEQGVHAFTVSFEGGKKEDNETDRAKKTAELFGAKFYNTVITADNYSKFMEKYIWHLEEPIGNESAAAYYFVANMAKGNVKVLLNGQGADEPFAGYDRYFGIHYSKYLNHFPYVIFRMLSNISNNTNKKNQFYRFYNYLNKDDFYSRAASAASILSEEQRSSLFNEDLFKENDNNDFSFEVEKVVNGFIDGDDLEKYLFYDMFTSLSENLLLCEDKMAMAASIEARVPFLDLELVSAALSIPSKYKVRNGKLKYIHKKTCEKYLPAEVIYQRKIGFNNPIDDWMTGVLGEELNDYICDNDSITNLYLNRQNVLGVLEEHKSKKVDHQRFLYLLYSLEKWRKTFLW